MKKFFTLSLFAVAALTASAQQVNGSFDGEWEACHPWEKGNYLTKDKGTQPTGWRVSNVYNSLVNLPEVAAKVENGDGFAVKLTNQSTTGQNVPAYLELGTPWATAETKGTAVRNADGGSFGGIDFKYRPDAIKFRYQRDNSAGEERASMVAYAWTGTWTQASVPTNTAVGIFSWGTATKVTMTDRDRNIVGKETILGGAITKSDDAKLVSFTEYYISDATTDWADAEVPVVYKDTETVPEKLNIIFSAADYFADRTGIKNKNSLMVDDVELVYYSTLKSLSVEGATIDFAEETSAYEADVVYTDGCVSFEKKAVGGTATGSFDAETNVYTIQVVGDDSAENVHTYTIAFKAGSVTPEPKSYSDNIIVTIDGESTEPIPATVLLTNNGDGTCTFVLKNFSLVNDEDAMPVGNICVEGVSYEEGEKYATIVFNGNITIAPGDDPSVDEEAWLGPMLDELPLVLTGKANDDKLFVNIDLDLSDSLGQIINVNFGKDDFDKEDDETAIAKVKVAAQQTIYDLSGRQVQQVRKGLYIVNGKKVVY